jgi:hypothetical protein
MIGIDPSILRRKAKIIVFTICYIGRRPAAGGGRNERCESKPVLKKFSSDCAASYFSFNVTKMQQFEMLSNRQERKANAIVDRFILFRLSAAGVPT